MNKFLMAIGLKKNDLTLENSEFIDKITNTNMLYSWSSHKLAHFYLLFFSLF